MRSEKLAEALGDVKDAFLQDADTAAKKKKNTWIRWSAAAACLCVIAGGVFLLTRPGTEVLLARPGTEDLSAAGSLPRIAVPAYDGGSMGFEGLLYFSPEELENGNPWGNKAVTSTLPVYKNGCFDPSGAGVPYGLSESEMSKRLSDAARALGLEILRTEKETDKEKDKSGAVLSGGAVYRLRAVTDRGRLTVSANGALRYEPPAGTALPEEYHFTYSDTTPQEAEAVTAYLAETYAALLDFAAPKIVLQGDYTFAGEYVRSYLVYDAGADPTEELLNYCFRCARFAPDDDGNLMLIDLYDGLAKAEKLGDYPLISLAQARERLCSGQYQTSVPVAFPGTEAIVWAEIVYRSGPREETLLPYYRFYAALPDADGWQMSFGNGLQTYGAYYVPAIQDAYLTDLPVYDGHFN